MDILLSIHEKYVEQMKTGQKDWEFRTGMFTSAKKGDKVFLYVTVPVQKIVGYFEIGRIVRAVPDRLWDKIEPCCKVPYADFKAYCKENGRKYAAIQVKNLTIFKNPINPKDLCENWSAPQTYLYLREGHYLTAPLINRLKSINSTVKA